jgi:hypothetical protein
MFETNVLRTLEPKGNDVIRYLSKFHEGNFIIHTVCQILLKVKISLLQAVEAPRVARGRGSHIS